MSPNLAFGIAEIRSLGQPQALYLWKFRIPVIPLGGDANALEFACRETSLEGHKTKVNTLQYQNGTITYPGNVERSGNSKTLTVLVTESRREYNALRRWRNASGHEVTGSALLTELIKTVGILTTFSVTGVPTYQILYNGLWVSGLGDLRLSQGSGDIATCDVTFAFDWTVT